MMDNAPEKKALFITSILQALLKGFSVFYFLLLPILYATNSLSAEQLGYIGAVLIVGILIGATSVTHKLHVLTKSQLLKVSFISLLVGTITLFWYTHIPLLIASYALIGLATGIGMSATNAIAGQFTSKGKRFGALAKIAMLTDIIRIAYPIIAGAIYASVGFTGLIFFALLTTLIFGLLILFLVHTRLTAVDIDQEVDDGKGYSSLRRSGRFQFVVILEFLDSFASSQLFVFLPALFIFKGFTIENSLFTQSAVFAGYLCGRWFVSQLAQRFNGFKAVGLAEAGMIVTILCLLYLPASPTVYFLCFLLGMFSRGTSPVIKALALDQLNQAQLKRGSAIHVIAGDSGSALGQLIFGLTLAWLGVTAPFIGSVFCAGIVALLCFIDPKKASR